MSMNNRQLAIKQVNEMDDDYFWELIVRGHETESCEWIEVNPSGHVHETSESDNYTRHFIEYPDKEVADIFTIHIDCAEAYCRCDLCMMYQNFRNMPKEEFIDSYSEDEYEYVSITSLEEAILDMSEISCDNVRSEIIENIEKIAYGYFDDEK